VKSILVYSLSIVFYLCFGSLLVVFHALQWIALNLFGYTVHKFTLDLLNYFILKCLNLLGTKILFEIQTPLPKDRPLIFVGNHQSTFEIPPIIWFLRRQHPKFISKKELGRGIPSVSFNLRHGGSVLIDRTNPKAALKQIKLFGQQLQKKNHSAIIFPEGTRSRDGSLKKFQKSGLICLFQSMPNALVVPISIGNSWRFGEHEYFPMPLGVKLHLTVHHPVEIENDKPNEFIERIEKYIGEEVKKKQLDEFNPSEAQQKK
jgi:1-acyl-sn-glycerol-3-phosphate acyltransferase